MSILRNDLFGIPIIVVDGEVDMEHYRELLQILDRVVSEGHIKIALDLSGVTSLDVTGVEILNSISDYLARDGGSLRLVGTSESVRRVLGQGPLLAA